MEVKNKSIDYSILLFAFSEKKYMLDLSNKIEPLWFESAYYNIYSILLKYFNKYKDVPSMEVLLEYFTNFTAEETLIITNIYVENVGTTLIAGDLGFLIKKLQDRFNLYLIQTEATQLLQNIKNVPITQLNNKIKQLTNNISTINKTGTFQQGSVSSSALNRWERYKDVEANPNLSKGILSKFKELDKHTNGIKESELMVVAGPSGSGKSIAIMNMGINAWLGSNTVNTQLANIKNDGKNVLFFTIEMPKEMLERRVDSNISGIPAYHIRDGSCSSAEKRSLQKIFKISS